MLEVILVLFFAVPALVLSRYGANKSNSDQSPAADPVDWEPPAESPFNSAWHDDAWRHDESDYSSFDSQSNYASSSLSIGDEDLKLAVNPATGLSMVSGEHSGVDVAGNPYGLDLQWSSSNDHIDCLSGGIGSSEYGFTGTGCGSLGGNDQWS